MKATPAKPGLVGTVKKSELDQLGDMIEIEVQTNAPPSEDAPGAMPSAAAGSPGADDDGFDMSGFTLEQCEDVARTGWEWAFTEIEEAAPYLKYPQEVKDKAAKKTAPVLYKYRDKMPEWFKKYKDEFMLGAFVGGLVFSGVTMYRAEVDRVKKLKEQKPADAPKPTPQHPQPVADNVTRTA